MTDIVERLDEHDPVDMEAKAEIERVRDAFERVMISGNYICLSFVELSEENDRLIAENERLQALVKKMSSLGVPGF